MLGHAVWHAFCTGPQAYAGSLDDIPSLQNADRSTQLGVVQRHAESALKPAVNAANKDVK